MGSQGFSQLREIFLVFCLDLGGIVAKASEDLLELFFRFPFQMSLNIVNESIGIFASSLEQAIQAGPVQDIQYLVEITLEFDIGRELDVKQLLQARRVEDQIDARR